MATFRPGDQPRTRSIAPVQTPPQPSKTKAEEAAQKKEKVSEESPTYTPNVRGADISLLNTLNNIVFVEGTDGGMSNEVAYIRYWKRRGTTGKTEVKANSGVFQSGFELTPKVAQEAWSYKGSLFERGPTLNTLDFTGQSLSTGFQIDPKTLFETDWDVNKNYWDIDLIKKTTSGSYVLTSATQGANSGQVPAPPAQTNPLSNLPSIPQNNYVNQFPTRVIRPKPTKFERIIYGRSFSANPSGVTLTAEPTAQIEDAVWQFLFNPEELQLESGPDYNKAETWGVSDPANSGQPLSWRNNKNRKLTFSKVILHGYTFGKRVEKLEEGLQRLFMARDGENGADGPPVLEFVWGRRFFGPCVIQNIRVREQAWDKGILVNAEVSFELEQVPEWTINDGEVDVARPGKQPLVNDPTLPGREQQEAAAAAAAGAGSDSGAGAGAGSQEPPKDKPGGGSPSSTPSYNARRCQRAYFYAGKFKQFQKSINEVNAIFGTREDFRRISTEFNIQFQNAATELGGGFASPNEATETYKKIEDILNPNRSRGRLDGSQIKGYISGYMENAFQRAKNIYNNQKNCPNTYGKTVLQRQVQIARPTNL